MADRGTHTIETPEGKHKVAIFDYLTGGDKRRLVTEQDEGKRITVLIESLVKSIDEKSGNVLGDLDSMHGKDFDFVVQELGRVAEASSLTAEKKS